MKRILSFIFIISLSTLTIAGSLKINKVEPGNWWVGMKLNKIQLMIYGSNFKNISAKFNNSSIKVLKSYSPENSNYAFIDIVIPPNLAPNTYQLNISSGKDKAVIDFPIYKREPIKDRFKGFDTKDAIYLIMPDRFVNGDYSNDSVPGYSDYMMKVPNQWRFGGDLQGVINKLDYIKDLGFTTIWLTPVVENNTYRSYHGYAATDFYNIDPRFGTNTLYKTFVEESHKRGLKVILDHVANHCSDDHFWMKNPPTKDWFNGTKENHLDANHNKMVFSDIHADSLTMKHIEQGWFVNTMPDLNQENSFMQNYIIQNTIWWMEYAGIDAIREDTYPYNNQKFMAHWANVIMKEYPTTNIVGEVWTGEPAFLSSYQKDCKFNKANTNLPALTDFALRDVLVRFVEGKNNVFDIYNVIAKDFLYANVNQLLTFLDNHDLPRIMYFAKGNVDKVKLAYDIFLTTRGIPQIFYGSEIGMVGTDDHGILRMPFPGGFKDDKRNAFLTSERTSYENDIFDHIKTLLQIRKEQEALTLGKLIQYPPAKDVYVYFRIYQDEKILVVVNNNPTEQIVDFKMKRNYISPGDNLKELRNGTSTRFANDYTLTVPPMKCLIYKVN